MISDYVHIGSLHVHMAQKKKIEDRNQFNFCAICNDWFEPVKTSKQMAEITQKRISASH